MIGTLASLLMGLAGPMVIRGLITLGFTAVTFAGVQTVVNGLITYAQNSWATMPTTILALASLCGLPEAAGLICGAYIARVTLWAAASSTRLIFTGRT